MSVKLPPLFWMSCPEVTAVASTAEGEGVAVGVGVVGEHVKGDTAGSSSLTDVASLAAKGGSGWAVTEIVIEEVVLVSLPPFVVPPVSTASTVTARCRGVRGWREHQRAVRCYRRLASGCEQ